MSRPAERPPRRLPDGWRWVKLGDMCRQDRQIVEPRTTGADSLTYYSLEHIESQTGRILKAPIGQVEDEGRSSSFRFDERHVLYGKLRPYLNKVALPESTGRCTTEMIPLLPGEEIDRIFLAWILRRTETVEYAMRGKTGSRMPRADMDNLLLLEIPLPSLPEQQRIAAILREQIAAVETARAAAQARLEAVKALPAAFAHDTFRAGHKHTHLLGDCLIEVKNGVGAGWSSYPVLGATRDGLAPAKESVGKTPERYKLVDPVTVFYNPMRILLGSIAMVDEGDAPGITSPDYVVVKGQPGVLDTRWFYYWFRSEQGAQLIDSLSRGAVRERIMFNRLAVGKIELPDYETQLNASMRMKLIKPIVESINIELVAINALPAALLRRAFNGEL